MWGAGGLAEGPLRNEQLWGKPLRQRTLFDICIMRPRAHARADTYPVHPHLYCALLPQVSHVSLDPLRRDQLAVLPLHRFRAAIVLADEGWGAGDSGEAGKQQQMQMQQQQQAMASPGDVIDQPSVLRQDALMVMVQVGAGRKGSGRRVTSRCRTAVCGKGCGNTCV